MEAPPEIRIDQLTGARVLVTPDRARRPEDFEHHRWHPGPAGDCPFCEGSEDQTPPEIEADRPEGSAPNGPGWRTRTVPNAYPALIPDAGDGDSGEAGPTAAFSSPADPLMASARKAEPDLFTARPATGHHEVVVNSPGHVTSLGSLSAEELELALAAWRRRMQAHSDSAYVQLIVNQGPDSGASLEHSHAQVTALPFVPAGVARERERFNAYRERTAGASLLEDVLREEIRRSERLVAIDDEVALICPWASRSPFEMRIIPRQANPRFDEDETGGSMLARALAALNGIFGDDVQLNLWTRTAPRGIDHFHWHLDLAPRLEPFSSFEMATGVNANVVAPELAAAELREAIA